MAYRGPQQQAQANAPSGPNTGNPNGVYNVNLKNDRYTPPTVDNNGRVTNSELLNFSLPRFGNQAPLMGLPAGMNPRTFLSELFGQNGSMVPSGPTSVGGQPAVGGNLANSGRPGSVGTLDINNPTGAPPTNTPTNNLAGAGRPGANPGTNINWQGNNSGVQQGPVGPNSNWSMLNLLANRGGNNLDEWVRRYRDQRLAEEGNGMSLEAFNAMQINPGDY